MSSRSLLLSLDQACVLTILIDQPTATPNHSLVPTSRYFPLRFHLVRSLLRIVQRTGTYIPLAAPLFEVLDSPDLTKRTKPTTLKPLDLEYYLKCPTAYQKTRVYGDALADETLYLLVEYYSALSRSIAFPELSLPAVVALKRHAKKTGQAKLGSMVKVLVDKLEANAKWIEAQREQIEFGPGKRDKVERFLAGGSESSKEAVSPLSAYLRVQRKVRDQKRATLERAVSIFRERLSWRRDVLLTCRRSLSRCDFLYLTGSRC